MPARRCLLVKQGVLNSVSTTSQLAFLASLLLSLIHPVYVSHCCVHGSYSNDSPSERKHDELTLENAFLRQCGSLISLKPRCVNMIGSPRYVSTFVQFIACSRTTRKDRDPRTPVQSSVRRGL